MASPVPDNNLSRDSPLTSCPQIEYVEDMIAWAVAHKDDPPHREKIDRTRGDGRKNHRGPIRIISKDSVLTEYGKKVEQERLAKLAATNENREGMEQLTSLTT
jgi:hypothetical protein